MCDTVVVVRDGEVWFAKNSDRDPNEAQGIDWVPARAHGTDAVLRCTWVAIPQVSRTHAVVLSRPFWMWGAEMGANEHGVVIGNEAVFTKAPKQAAGLTGMDLVRLGLERSGSAQEAVETIAALLRRHGQGGRAGYSNPSFTYDNSFLVADRSGAFVVETAGREVEVASVPPGVRAISNGLTLPALTPRADRLRGWVAACRARRSRVEELAARATSVADLAGVLRDHGSEGSTGPHHRWLRGAMAGPCVHHGGVVAGSQTVGSWIARVGPDGGQHWVTGTSAPCMSVFRPVDLHNLAPIGRPEGTPDPSSLWWRFEALHRRWLVDEAGRAEAMVARDRLERAAFSDPADGSTHWRAADRWLDRHRAALAEPPGPDRRPAWLRRVWSRVDEEARRGNRLPPRAVDDRGGA